MGLLIQIVKLEDGNRNSKTYCNSKYIGANVVSMCIVPVTIKQGLSKVLGIYAMLLIQETIMHLKLMLQDRPKFLNGNIWKV